MHRRSDEDRGLIHRNPHTLCLVGRIVLNSQQLEQRAESVAVDGCGHVERSAVVQRRGDERAVLRSVETRTRVGRDTHVADVTRRPVDADRLGVREHAGAVQLHLHHVVAVRDGRHVEARDPEAGSLRHGELRHERHGAGRDDLGRHLVAKRRQHPLDLSDQRLGIAHDVVERLTQEHGPESLQQDRLHVVLDEWQHHGAGDACDIWENLDEQTRQRRFESCGGYRRGQGFRLRGRRCFAGGLCLGLRATREQHRLSSVLTSGDHRGIGGQLGDHVGGDLRFERARRRVARDRCLHGGVVDERVLHPRIVQHRVLDGRTHGGVVSDLLLERRVVKNGVLRQTRGFRLDLTQQTGDNRLNLERDRVEQRVTQLWVGRVREPTVLELQVPHVRHGVRRCACEFRPDDDRVAELDLVVVVVCRPGVQPFNGRPHELLVTVGH